MADRQLELWINERWYEALEKHFGGEEAVQQKLEDMLDSLIDQLPDHICDQVSREIREEDRQQREAAEAARHILDRGEFAALNAQHGRENYTVRDVCAARLEGKEITPEHRLDLSRITFSGEIMEMAGQLNFYVNVDFDPDYAFGTNVCTDENDDWVNVYANYDMGKGQVCGALEINLCRGDGTEKAMLYPLSPAEKKELTGKMEAFCQEQTGLSLKDYCAQIQAEDIRVVDGAAAPKKAARSQNDRGAR